MESKLGEDSSEENTASETEYRGGYSERVSRSPDLGADRGFDSRLAHRVATYAN
jgi:hypothetical protein